jgi:hypothetical protein
VVVAPETQVTVPPVAKLVADSGSELPPVLPPVHPLIVSVPDAFPVNVVHVIFPVAAPAVPAIPNVRPATGMSMAARVSNIRRIGSLPYSRWAKRLFPLCSNAQSLECVTSGSVGWPWIEAPADFGK